MPMWGAITSWVASFFAARKDQVADFQALSILAKEQIERLLIQNERLSERLDAHLVTAKEAHEKLHGEIDKLHGEISKLQDDLAECERKHAAALLRRDVQAARIKELEQHVARLEGQNARQQAEIDALTMKQQVFGGPQ